MEDCAPGPGGGALPQSRCPAWAAAPASTSRRCSGPLVLSFWFAGCKPCKQEMPALQAFHDQYGDRVPVIGVDFQDQYPGSALEEAGKRGVTYPSLADPGGDLQGFDEFAKILGMPTMFFVDADGAIAYQEFGGLDSAERGRRPGPRAPRSRSVRRPVQPGAIGLPDWLRPVEDAARSITVHDLTRFMPPEDEETRASAVLMLFGEGPDGPDLLLTERSHTMRSHPGQVSFPGGSVDPGETAQQTALREAEEETGLGPDGVEVFAELPPLWLPPSNFSVTPVLAWWREPSAVHAVSADEVHAVYRVPISELRDPTHRIRSHARRVAQPRLPDRRRPRRHLLGLHRRRDRPPVRVPRLDRGPPRRARAGAAGVHAGRVVASTQDVQPNTEFEERRRG